MLNRRTVMRHAIAAVCCGLVVLALGAGADRFMVRAQEKPLAFDAASVRASAGPPYAPGFQVVPERFTATDLPLAALIRRAYGVPYWKVRNVPDWVNAERFTVTATAPSSATPEQMNAMLRSLLEQRFRLVAAMESSEMDADEMTLARSDRQLGPGLHPVNIDCATNQFRGGSSSTLFAGFRTRPACGSAIISATFSPGEPDSLRRLPLKRYAAITMGHLADTLSASRDRPVLDRTGLDGLFDVELNYESEQAPAARDAAAAAPGSAPTLAVALEEQLGFRLRRERHQIDFLTVRSVERPRASEN
jgi:uncharacterized protein (TIGR03435 family)